MEARALGKGLSALIPEKKEIHSNQENKSESITYLATADIRANSLQPRMDYDEKHLQELIASIKEKGVLQPILVRKKEGAYEIIAGERRLRAAKYLNLQKVPVVVRDANDDEALVLALVENIQREELNAIEEAEAYKKLIEQFGFSQEKVADSVGKDRSTISNTLRLLNLPKEIQKAISGGELSAGHARALLSIQNPAEQRRVFEYTIEEGLSVRELEKLVQSGLKAIPEKKQKSTKIKDSQITAFEEALQRIFGTKVTVFPKKKKGKIVIEYYSLTDLERILNILKK